MDIDAPLNGPPYLSKRQWQARIGKTRQKRTYYEFLAYLTYDTVSKSQVAGTSRGAWKDTRYTWDYDLDDLINMNNFAQLRLAEMEAWESGERPDHYEDPTEQELEARERVKENERRRYARKKAEEKSKALQDELSYFLERARQEQSEEA